MVAESARAFDALEAQAASLLDLFKGAGYEYVAPAVLQPADILLDEIGEGLRARTYVFTAPDGEELCLRPDLTVPVCRLYLERHPAADVDARYCYNGPAFRYQPGGQGSGPREFRQLGVECIGADQPSACEAEVVALAVDAVRRAGLEAFRLRFGDIKLFVALIEALDLPQRWRHRLRHYFWRTGAFHELLRCLAEGGRAPSSQGASDLLPEIEGLSPEAAIERVFAHLQRTGRPLIGERSIEEITARLLDQGADLRAGALPKPAVAVIEAFLAVSGSPRVAAGSIAEIARSAGVSLDDALEFYTRRFDLLEARGLALDGTEFVAEFGRNLEYYTGLVFQIEAASNGSAAQVAGGGRYDRLLESMGAPRATPAIGCAIHTERLLAAVQGRGF